MLKIFSTALAALFISTISLESKAQAAADCIQTDPGTFVTFQLRPDNSYMNCMGFTGSESSTHITISSTSAGKLPHLIRLLLINANGTVTPISEHTASEGVAFASIQPNGRKFAIAVLPTDGSTSKLRSLRVLHVKESEITSIAITLVSDDAAA